jgi:hypothetical protein
MAEEIPPLQFELCTNLCIKTGTHLSYAPVALTLFQIFINLIIFTFPSRAKYSFTEHIVPSYMPPTPYVNITARTAAKLLKLSC